MIVGACPQIMLYCTETATVLVIMHRVRRPFKMTVAECALWRAFRASRNQSDGGRNTHSATGISNACLSVPHPVHPARNMHILQMPLLPS